MQKSELVWISGVTSSVGDDPVGIVEVQISVVRLKFELKNANPGVGLYIKYVWTSQVWISDSQNCLKSELTSVRILGVSLYVLPFVSQKALNLNNLCIETGSGILLFI